MRILVTGGAGFIGSHLVESLLNKGHQVRILDNLHPKIHSDTVPVYIPTQTEFMVGDVTDKSSWEKALAGIEIVFHEAAYQDYLPDYGQFFDVNVTGTALMYQVIREKKYPIQKIVVASSQAVYGEGQYECSRHGVIGPSARAYAQLDRGDWDIRCPQCDQLMRSLPSYEIFANPYNQYALSKYSQEIVAIRLGRFLRIPTVALRYSITQGPRQSIRNQYSGICRIFTLRILNNQPPVLFEDGFQTRDFIHIDDVVRANMIVLENQNADYEVFNVGSGRATTIIEYARLLIVKLAKNIEPCISGAYREGDIRHSLSDIQKLRNLGWEPKKSLDNIFDDYLAWAGSIYNCQDYFTQADHIMRQSGVIRETYVSRNQG